jgi:hypothetical protein
MVSNLADLVLIKPVEIDQLTTLITRMGTFGPGPRLSLPRPHYPAFQP